MTAGRRVLMKLMSFAVDLHRRVERSKSMCFWKTRFRLRSRCVLKLCLRVVASLSLWIGANWLSLSRGCIGRSREEVVKTA